MRAGLRDVARSRPLGDSPENAEDIPQSLHLAVIIVNAMMSFTNCPDL